MIVNLQHETFGPIVYDENVWTGKRRIFINGTEIKKIKKNLYEYQNGEEKLNVSVKGNFISGIKLIIGAETIDVERPAKFYEIFCSCIIFALVLVWGNSVELCAIFPIIGGAIGGAVSGLMAFFNLLWMKSANGLVKKLLIWVGMLVATVMICYVLALLYIALLLSNAA